MTRNKKQTVDLLKRIAGLTVEVQSGFDECEPEYDPNENLALVYNLLDLIHQEGPVYHRLCICIAESYNVEVDVLYKVLGAIRGVRMETIG